LLRILKSALINERKMLKNMEQDGKGGLRERERYHFRPIRSFTDVL